MNESSKSSKSDEASSPKAKLALPDGSGFRSKRPSSISLNEMIRLSKSRLRMINSAPDAEEKRLASKCRVPFKLIDP